ERERLHGQLPVPVPAEQPHPERQPLRKAEPDLVPAFAHQVVDAGGEIRSEAIALERAGDLGLQPEPVAEARGLGVAVDERDAPADHERAEVEGADRERGPDARGVRHAELVRDEIARAELERERTVDPCEGGGSEERDHRITDSPATSAVWIASPTSPLP